MTSKKQLDPGDKYGCWTVLDSRGKQIFCQCGCGTQKLVCKYSLIKGRSTNCGCKNKTLPLPLGSIYGNLTVASVIEDKGLRGELLTFVTCSCSTQKYVSKNSLRQGLTRSCGCLRNNTIKQKRTTHGLSSSYEYKAWLYIKSICYNRNHGQYKYYGGCGIEVSADWRNNFGQFIVDMGKAPPDTKIARFDIEGNFLPTNCLWISRDKRISKKLVKDRNLITNLW